MTIRKDLRIHVPTVSRVEGEGALHVRVTDGQPAEVELEIYEPPRFFEALLRGRDREEPIDITARVCGICPIAYQMTAAQAVESISGVRVEGQLGALRRLVYCGEWIESHVLHIGFLHAPDFLGYSSGLEIARDQPELIEKILELKKVGNDIVEVIGGRPIHPVNIRLGGFHRVPDRDEVGALAQRLSWAQEAAVEVARWTAGLEFPDLRTDHEFVSLSDDPGGYPILGTRIVSDRGLDVEVSEFEHQIEESQVAYSTARHVHRTAGTAYLTGPLARWSNNHHALPGDVRALASELGIGPVVRNPFRSIVVRALEVVYAVGEAARLVARYEPPTAPTIGVPVRAGVGHGATEAPRGVLYHRFETDAVGTLLDARIIPPTAQNQPVIEDDVRRVVQGFVDHHDGEAFGDDEIDLLRHRCETAIRNYDPCISCATHFLRVDVEHR